MRTGTKRVKRLQCPMAGSWPFLWGGLLRASLTVYSFCVWLLLGGVSPAQNKSPPCACRNMA